MKLFIDSAHLDEIKESYRWGIMDGVTTNPSLLKKAVEHKKIDLKKYITEILRIAKGTPVSLEVTATTAAGMVEEGKNLFALFNRVANNVVVKIPINPALTKDEHNQFDGLRAIKELRKAKIPVNCTLIFTPEQALLAAKAGATFVSPFAGRLDDYLRQGTTFDKKEYYPAQGKKKDDHGLVSGIDLVEQCVTILRKYNFKTQVLAASLRNCRQVREAALVGADCATLPFSVLKELVQHPKTYEGVTLFTNDAVKEYGELK